MGVDGSRQGSVNVTQLGIPVRQFVNDPSSRRKRTPSFSIESAVTVSPLARPEGSLAGAEVRSRA